jgi:thymidine phosphorylase
MKISIFKILTLLTVMTLFIATSTSCSEDDGPTVNITVNEGPSGDIGGDFTGDGGNGSRIISWTNNLPTADYNADITATASGIFQIVVADANGSVVLDRTLNGGTEPDTIDGVTGAGEPGDWTVTITLTLFNGDGSYSLSAGD